LTYIGCTPTDVRKTQHANKYETNKVMRCQKNERKLKIVVNGKKKPK